MKYRIRKEALEWYESVEDRTGQSIETLVDFIMNRTAEALVDEVKTVLKKDFRDGTLKHNHVVSPEYYLELKLKEARQNLFRSDKTYEPNQKGRDKDEVV